MSPRPLVPLLALLLPALPLARAQLPQCSPFVPVDSETAAPTAESFFVFFGYIESPDGLRFRVNDTTRKTGAWVRLNEPNETLGIVAKEHDAGRELLFVEHEGRPLTLPMHRAKIVNSGATPAARILSPMIPTPQPVTTTPANAASATLDKLAEAIAQRRALRATAAK